MTTNTQARVALGRWVDTSVKRRNSANIHRREGLRFSSDVFYQMVLTASLDRFIAFNRGFLDPFVGFDLSGNQLQNAHEREN